MVMIPVRVHVMLAEEAARPLLERLDAPHRTAVFMALLGIVLAGIFLVACVVIGARWVRRLARQDERRRRTGQLRESQRLRQSLRGILPKTSTSDTVSIDAAGDETRVDPPPPDPRGQ
jgi:hypothetical protein